MYRGMSHYHKLDTPTTLGGSCGVPGRIGYSRLGAYTLCPEHRNTREAFRKFYDKMAIRGGHVNEFRVIESLCQLA